jgi:TrmH family RNA methyltransferase
MLSKAKIKEIRALEFKKFRDKRGLFVAEGNKLVADMLPAFSCEWLIASASWLASRGGDLPTDEWVLAGEGDIHKVSFLKSPQDVVAVFRKPAYRIADANPASRLILALDGIQVPGNLGTIVRLADWFGIEHIVCSKDSADVFCPKAMQATMGGLAHVKVHYTGLEDYLAGHAGCPVYGTGLEGENIYAKKLAPHGVIILGNEGKGVRPETAAFVKERLYIPPYPPLRTTTDSLNVAMAAAIVCAEFRRVAAANGYPRE